MLLKSSGQRLHRTSVAVAMLSASCGDDMAFLCREPL
jgi:hypothetical protein